jgi:hypothetical protein
MRRHKDKKPKWQKDKMTIRQEGRKRRQEDENMNIWKKEREEDKK